MKMMPDREKVIKGLEFTKAMITFNPSTGEDIEPGNLNEADKTTYDACVGAIALLKEQEAITIKKTKEPYGYGVYGGICPKCRNWIQSAHSFCGFCGQAVKWNGY